MALTFMKLFFPGPKTMRTLYGTDEGARIADTIKFQIETNGYPLTLTPPPASAAAGAPVLNVNALMEVPTLRHVQKLQQEGILNMDATEPYIVTFAADSDVLELSTFVFDGNTYKVFRKLPQPYQRSI